MANESYDQTTEMAKIIEKMLGNTISRQALKFCTAKCKCGRRVELALKKYAGEDVPMCAKCKTSSLIIIKVLDYFAKKGGIEKQLIIDSVKIPYWRKGLATTLEGIAEFGPKKPFTGSSPFLIVWNVTKACNLACKHCYESAHIKAPDELTTEEAIAAIDKLADNGLAYIAVSGGEPMMRPDFFTLAEHMKKREIALSIATNATIITPQLAKKLKDVNCVYAQVSLDGATAKTHDFFRGRESFNRTLQGIKCLVDAGIIVGISCTVTHYNLKEVPEAIDLAEKLGVQAFMHYNFIPTGRGKEIVDMDITPQEKEKLLNMLAKENGKRKISLLSTAPQFARVCTGFSSASMTHFDVFSKDAELSNKVKPLADFVGGCGAGRLYMAMEPNGDLEPCVFIQKKLGNIKTIDFKKMWRTDKDLLAIRDRSKFGGHCGKCKFRSSCGGCRARSYGYYGTFTNCDPGCILNVKEWDKLKKKDKKSSNSKAKTKKKASKKKK